MKSPSTVAPLTVSVSQGRGLARYSEKGRNPYDGLRPWSAITHGVGVALAVLGTVLLLIRSVALGLDVWHIVSFAIYGASMICLYAASTLDHCVNGPVPRRLALRKYDHCSISLLIAGSYTPICLVALRTCGGWGWAIFGVIWAMAMAACSLSLLWINSPRWITAGTYLMMGWLAIIALYPLARALPRAGMVLLVLGGLLYTVGGVLYALKWPGRNNPRFGCHEVFHLFILAGSLFHFLVMYRVVCFL